MHRRTLEFRVTAKSLAEQRADALEEMQSIIDNAKAETRAMTEEETDKLDALGKSVETIDKSMNAEKRALEKLSACRLPTLLSSICPVSLRRIPAICREPRSPSGILRLPQTAVSWTASHW